MRLEVSFSVAAGEPADPARLVVRRILPAVVGGVNGARLDRSGRPRLELALTLAV
jgi:hypothetical protein